MSGNYAGKHVGKQPGTGAALRRPLASAPMTERDEQGRPEPPMAADETTTLLAFLDFHRATFAWKCAGLDSAGLQATVGVSTMTLGGMLKHLALVEDSWFSRRLHDQERQPPWNAVDWHTDEDWDWRTAADDSPDELRGLWEKAVTRSRTLVDE